MLSASLLFFVLTSVCFLYLKTHKILRVTGAAAEAPRHPKLHVTAVWNVKKEFCHSDPSATPR